MYVPSVPLSRSVYDYFTFKKFIEMKKLELKQMESTFGGALPCFFATWELAATVALTWLSLYTVSHAIHCWNT